MKQTILAEPILVGRESELEEFNHCLASAVQGKGTIVFSSGEAGSGKTRLTKEFLNSAKQEQNVTTLVGSCLSNAAVPYYPFFESFTNHFGAESSREGKSNKIQKEEQEIKSWLSLAQHKTRDAKCCHLKCGKTRPSLRSPRQFAGREDWGFHLKPESVLHRRFGRKQNLRT